MFHRLAKMNAKSINYRISSKLCECSEVSYTTRPSSKELTDIITCVGAAAHKPYISRGVHMPFQAYYLLKVMRHYIGEQQLSTKSQVKLFQASVMVRDNMHLRSQTANELHWVCFDCILNKTW